MHAYHCKNCQASQTFIQHTRSQYCEKPDCQRAKVQAYLDSTKQQLLNELQDSCKQELRQLAASPTANEAVQRLSLGVKQSTPTMAIVPANQNMLVEACHQRREEFLTHLATVYDDVENNIPAAHNVYSAQLNPPFSAREEELLGKACATCRGHCCRLGKTHAFQDQASLQYFLESQESPLSKSQLLELYEKYLPETSYRDGCVFQGEKGCTLPKEQRSFTCNNFQCEALGDYHARMAKSYTSLSYVAAVHKEQIIYSSVYDEQHFIPIKQ